MTATRDSGRNILRPRARMLHTLGDELISNDTVAVIELVKNAYDADATIVVVKFHSPLEKGQGAIEVIDNGHGMSLETIQTTWMEPATNFRVQNRHTSEFGRRVLGEKGIGRFASARLAESLTLISRQTDALDEIWTYFDWTQFDDEEKYLDQVEILWNLSEPTEICPGGTIDKAKKYEKHLLNSERYHGTILLLDKLKSTWSYQQLEELRLGLSRLVSPFHRYEQIDRNASFDIILDIPGFSNLSGVVEPPEILLKPPYVLRGTIDANGQYDVALELNGPEGRVTKSRQAQFKVESRESGGRLHTKITPRCGPFEIELRVWDRDMSSLKALGETYGSSVGEIRHELDQISGINIYRDGFRVLPYGEPQNDWLRLDLRRVQNPTLRLSNNQIVGFVLITSTNNPNLKDQSNREGIMDSPELRDLQNLIIQFMALLENERYQLRPRKDGKSVSGLFKDFDLISIRNYVVQNYPADKNLQELLGAKEAEIQDKINEAQTVIARYRRLASLGQLIDTVLHDGRTPLSKISIEAKIGLVSSNQLDLSLPAATDVKRAFELIVNESQLLADVFRKIEPFGGRKRGRPEMIRLETVIADACAILQTDITKSKVQISLPDSVTNVTVDSSEIQMVIMNLLENSLYWLNQVPPEQRAITVQVERTYPNEVVILFSDSGPGVDPDFAERIFDPYMSTKPNGIGLGLTIAGEIIREYYDGSLELLDEGPLSGATFRLTLHRRF